MELKEKRKQEQESAKNQRKEEVIVAALDIFKTKGIESTKMTEIAERAELGVASLYRYFKTKPEIVVEAACKLWQDEIATQYEVYTAEAFLAKKGAEQVREILEVFLVLYRDHQDFLRFLDEFDRYIVKEHVSAEKLKAYEKSIIDLKPILIKALEVGKADGSIRTEVEAEAFYFSITHGLMSLCQKLILRGKVLESDDVVQGEVQIQTIIDMAVNYII